MGEEEKENTIEDFSKELQYLSTIYNFRNPDGISEFLSDKLSVIHLLKDVYKKIREYFPNENLFLEVLYDFEVPNEKELVIFIQTNLTVDEAIDKLKQFDEEWTFKSLQSLKENLCINLEFV